MEAKNEVRELTWIEIEEAIRYSPFFEHATYAKYEALRAIKTRLGFGKVD